MKVQTILYGPCKLPDHTDCTRVVKHYEGTPKAADIARYEVERDARPERTTYRLTAKV